MERIVMSKMKCNARYFLFSVLMIMSFYVFQLGITLHSDVYLTEKSLENRMTERLDHVTQVCSDLHIRQNLTMSEFSVAHPPAPQYSVFYFQPEKQIAYCPIYKAASTSLLDWLLSINNIDAKSIMKYTDRQMSDVARDVYPSVDYPQAEKLLKESTRVMVVRHPFERLLSAYRDKLEDHLRGPQHGTFYYHRKFGRRIVSKYRKSNSTRPEPSFEEFVDYLIDTDLALYADDHWIPFYLFCTPCLVDYDFIVYFETLDEDFLLLLQRLNVERGPQWEHSALGGSSSQVARSYFEKLSKVKVQRLFEKYRMDFQLFGYDADPYFDIARDDE